MGRKCDGFLVIGELVSSNRVLKNNDDCLTNLIRAKNKKVFIYSVVAWQIEKLAEPFGDDLILGRVL